MSDTQAHRSRDWGTQEALLQQSSAVHDSEELLRRRGRMWLHSFFSCEEIDTLARLAEVGEKPGARLEYSAELSKLIGPGSRLGARVKTMGLDELPVRLVAFNKSSQANWSVPWHQDRVIALAERKEVAGYSNWVSKGGFWHCEAPESLLNKMIFVRIHIDDTTEGNGPLELALGSHRLGATPATNAATVAQASTKETCTAASGDVLIAHALTLHRSKSATTSATRRALRIDYAPRTALAPELQWAIQA